MGDGGDDFRIGSGGIQHNEGVVGFVGIAFVDGFGKAFESAVLVKGGGLTDEDGGVFGSGGALCYEDHLLSGVFCVEFGKDVFDAFLCQSGVFDLSPSGPV